jgi:shikimate dehydrogenase
MIAAAERPARLVLLGHPVAHSLSPVFQTAALRDVGLPIRYDALDVPPSSLDQTLAMLARERGAGNVTIPHKEVVASRAQCSALARRVGAVNTFWHDDGVLVGHNTDVAGARATIERLYPSNAVPRRAAVLGAGGSAAAVIVALTELGCAEIAVYSRTPTRAEHLAKRLGVDLHVTTDGAAAVAGADLVINATPIGLEGDELPIQPTALEPDTAVFDLVYRAGETAWVRRCRAAGHRALDGLPMLIEQGAAAFECWFGTPAPRDVMWRAVTGARA